MSQQIAEFFAKITADTTPAQQSLQKFGVQLEKTAAKAKQGGGVVDGLKNHISGLINPTALAIGGFTALTGAVASSFGEYQRYAHDVRNLSIATGQNARETSILIQTMDDFEISAGDMQTAARFLKEKGLSPTVETLAQLSDQFLAIQDPAERLKFAQDNLGRSYQSYLTLLAAGSDKIMQTAQGTNKWNILTEEQMKTADEARLKIDALSDSWNGFWIQTGARVGEWVVAGDRQATMQEKLQGLYRMTFDEIRKASIGNRDFAESVKATEAQLKRGAAATEYYHNLMEKGIITTQSAAQKQEELASVILDTGFKFVDINEKVAASEEEIKNKFQGTTTVTNMYATELARLEKLKADGTLNTNQYERALEAVNKKHAEGQLDEVIANTQNSAYVTELYKQKLQDLKDALAEGTISQEAFSQATTKLNADFASGAFGIEQQRQALAGLRDAVDQSFEEQALAALKAKDATNQQQLDFAVAAGLMTQDAANQAAAMDKVTDAFKDGSLTAQQYVTLVHQLADALNGLDGTQANTMINLLITQQGAGYSNFNVQTGGNKNKNKPPIAIARGGKLPLGQGWAIVGDRPGGGLTPWTEAVSPEGEVVNARTTQWLMKMGLLGDAGSYAQPGDDWGVSSLPPPTVTTTTTTNRTRGGGGRGGGGSSVTSAMVGLESPAASSAAAATSQQVAQEVGQQVTQAMETYTNMAQDKFDEMINALKYENPRAVGKQINYEMAKRS